MKQHLQRISILVILSPLDKLLLVRQLKEICEVVIVTGDGTNDASMIQEPYVSLTTGIQGVGICKGVFKHHDHG